MLNVLRAIARRFEWLRSACDYIAIRAGFILIDGGGKLKIKRLKISQRSAYRPVYQPWATAEFLESYDKTSQRSLLTKNAKWNLVALARQTKSLPGELWECGVYRGGTARMLVKVAKEFAEHSGTQKLLRLFDTFDGMPDSIKTNDIFEAGAFSDTSQNTVADYVGDINSTVFHKGFIPDSFEGLEGSLISFAHVDVDIEASVLECCNFIYPRLVKGGIILFDDYGFAACPGARHSVDRFFYGKPEEPFVLPTGQAFVIKI